MHLVKPLQDIKPSFLRTILDNSGKDNTISLAGGLPDEKCFPLDIIEQCFAKILTKPSLFQYDSTEGYQPLIDYIHEAYALPDTHEALICTGSQQAIDLTIRAFIAPGSQVVIEAPCYLGALQALKIAQADVLTADTTPSGPDLDQLEAVLANNNVKMFYAVPDFNNPTGVCWSLNTRKAVASLCERYDVLLLEDVPYRYLRFSGESLPLVSDFCPQRSIVTRSFSKVSTPGIRLGVVTGLAHWIKALVYIKQAADLHTSSPMQSMLLSLAKHDGFTTHLENSRALYRSRYLAFTKAISEKLPASFNYLPVEGGMFLWLQMPGIDVDLFAEKALEHGVVVLPSTAFYPESHPDAAPALRLNFTHSDAEQLVEAVDRMAKVLESMP